MILIGAFCLALPIAHAEGSWVSPLHALFTATSAVCVTGLAVADTGSDFSRFGQVVLMLLIQVGGFGVITVGMLVAMAGGRRLGFRERLDLQTQINSPDVGGVERLIFKMLLLVLGIELAGALLLYVRLYDPNRPGVSFFEALFHSISAFNNAGFALYSDSLSQFVGDPAVNFVIIMLILLGGLGFIVLLDLLRRVWPRQRIPLSLHTQMALWASGILLIAALLVVLLFEWSNPSTLGTLPWYQRLLAALFQAVTPRTAGFNTLDYSAMRGGTQVFTILLMFIGGNPGSTAGGIKTVTLFVIAGSAWSLSRGHREVIFFGRRLSQELIIRAFVITFFSVMVSGAALTLLTLTEPNLDIFALIFETISAISTAGLSVGITGELSAVGKLIIIGLMYLGRLGTLTIALAFIEKRAAPGIRYPSEDVLIG